MSLASIHSAALAPWVHAGSLEFVRGQGACGEQSGAQEIKTHPPRWSEVT